MKRKKSRSRAIVMSNQSRDQNETEVSKKGRDGVQSTVLKASKPSKTSPSVREMNKVKEISAREQSKDRRIVCHKKTTRRIKNMKRYQDRICVKRQPFPALYLPCTRKPISTDMKLIRRPCAGRIQGSGASTGIDQSKDRKRRG